MEIAAGRVVANKYELVRLIGRGAMGQVWAAHHRTLGDHVALKLMSRSLDIEEGATSAKRFLFEAQIAARLSRKTRHIVRVTDHGEDDGLVYLVMELLDGETLETLLARSGPLPLADVTKIVAQVARALGQAHAEGVVHRDLKPANVFLTHDEDGGLLIKLLDFGIARATQPHRTADAFATREGFVFGTPGYMSPEQARGARKLEHEFDLWALAAIAYEGLTGQLPVMGTDADELLKNLCAGRIVPLREREPDLPKTLGAFFDRAFADRVEHRYPSASELALAFERAAAGQAAEDLEVTRKYVKRSSKIRLAVTLALALVGLIVAAAVWRAIAGSSSAPPAAPPLARAPVESSGRKAPAKPPEPWVPVPSESPAVTPESLPSITAVPPAPPHGPLPGARAPGRPSAPPSASPSPTSKPIDKGEVF